MTISSSERSVVLAARALAKFEARRERMKAKFAQQIISIDINIAEAKEALRTFTDGGQETTLAPSVVSGGEAPRLMQNLREAVGLGRSER